MSDRTIMQMEIHPAIIRWNQFRSAIRMTLNMSNQALERLEEYRKQDEAFLQGDKWPIGTTLTIRKPQRFQVG